MGTKKGTKPRKWSKEEKLKLVLLHLNEKVSLMQIEKEYSVSNGLVSTWVKKYLELGEDGLKDNRGKRKDESQLSELERLRRENERLKRQLELKEREEIILKKLQEVERRRYSPKENRNRSI